METRHSGLLFPSKGPTFLSAKLSAGRSPRPGPGSSRTALRPFLSVGHPFLAVLFVLTRNPPTLINLPRHRYIQLPQHVLYFRIPQARGVVLKRQMILVVDPDPPQTVGVRKRSQRAKFFLSQRLLQFVSCFHKCHARHGSTHCSRARRRSPWAASARSKIACCACCCNIGVGGILLLQENNN